MQCQSLSTTADDFFSNYQMYLLHVEIKLGLMFQVHRLPEDDSCKIIIRVSKRLDPDQDGRSLRTDLGTSYQQTTVATLRVELSMSITRELL